jgi:hypothetical protein
VPSISSAAAQSRQHGVLIGNDSLADMSSILALLTGLRQAIVFVNRKGRVPAPPRGVLSGGGLATFGRVKQPAPLRLTGPNEDGTHAVSVSVDVRVSDWAALRAGRIAAAEESDGVVLSDAAVIALAIAEGMSKSTLPAGIELCHVHVNYLRAAVARDVPAAD